MIEHKSTTNQGVAQQLLDNLPHEILALPRWLPTRRDNHKRPVGDKWQLPENQKPFADVEGIKGFVASTEAEGGLLFVDFDHCVDNGDFINSCAADWFSRIQQGKYFAELSTSGTGCHIWALPTAGEKTTGKIFLTDDRKSFVEVFYGTTKFCLPTGKLFRCQSNAPIAKGSDADKILQELRAALLAAQETKQGIAPADLRKPALPLNDSGEYDQWRATRMLDAIEPARLSYEDWLATVTACKTVGLPYSVVDAFNRRDPDRYNERENLAKWNEPVNLSFSIESLHGLAKRFGYSEREAQVEWRTLRGDRKRKSKQDFARADFQSPPENSLPEKDRAALYSGDFSDDSYARRLVATYGDRFRYLQNPDDEWLIFQRNDLRGGVWKNAGEKNSVLYPFATDLADKLFANARNKTEQNIGLKLREVKKKNSSIAAIKGLRSVMITPADLDTHDNLLNCLNGVVDLESGKIFDADPSLLITQQANAVYRQGVYSPVVDKFLADILPDEPTREALIRFLGYSATGLCCEEKALFCCGSGGNGKGTLTKTLLLLFGDYAAPLRVSSVLFAGKEQDAGAATTELTPLENCRAAFIEELPQGGKLDVAKFKNLTGGDKIPIRKLHREQSTIEPHFSLILSGNFLPEISDTRDNGLLRRLLNINFTQSFIGKARDPQLKAKLATADALSGLLSRIVAAAQMWYKHGLLESDEMKSARADYLAENDFIGMFINEYCQRGADLSIPRQEFLAKLKATCAGDCLRLFGNRDRALAAAVNRIEGISMRRGAGGARRFFGVGWKSNRFDGD